MNLAFVIRDKKQSAKIFGDVLRTLRLERGFTQDKLAERANTERSHVSALERAEKSPSLATIFVLADALSMPASELIKLVEQELQSIRS